jgi:hypothetical protein
MPNRSKGHKGHKGNKGHKGHKSDKTYGGQSGAAGHTLSTYGNFDQQMKQLNEGNELRAEGQPVSMMGGTCGVPLLHGGSALAQVAVPAVLLVANNQFSKTKKSFKKFKMGKRTMRYPNSRKIRGSRRRQSGKR